MLFNYTLQTKATITEWSCKILTSDEYGILTLGIGYCRIRVTIGKIYDPVSTTGCKYNRLTV